VTGTTVVNVNGYDAGRINYVIAGRCTASLEVMLSVAEAPVSAGVNDQAPEQFPQGSLRRRQLRGAEKVGVRGSHGTPPPPPGWSIQTRCRCY
jgi:hypothetical protein